MASMSSFKRVQQYLVFARQWHLLDAKWQDPQLLGEKIARYISGMNKPLYHPESDCGDNVIVYNCKDIAMRGFDWKQLQYDFDNRLPQGRRSLSAWEIHSEDPLRIVWMTTYYALRWPFPKSRRRDMEKLHLFADANVPPELLKNVGNQLEQVMRVPKRVDEYSQEERRNFPAVYDLPTDYANDPGEK